MSVLGVVPARMGATRFPGKPLVSLAGRPLVQWVYEAAAGCPLLDEVVVATPDDEIAEAVRAFGGRAVMTRADHPSGTDRVAEVAQARPDARVVVNVQGDQPFVDAAMLSALVAPFTAPDLGAEDVEMTTVGAPLAPALAADPGTVKVVCDLAGRALYFSRAPIPHRRDPDVDTPVLHHLGLYAYESEFLARFAALVPTPLERAEGLEQLRALEHGHAIRVCPVERAVPEVNTPEDLVVAEQLAARLERQR